VLCELVLVVLLEELLYLLGEEGEEVLRRTEQTRKFVPPRSTAM
jgi:hypothetical protein